MKLSEEQAKIFASAFQINEIKQYISDHKTDYERWLADQEAAEQPAAPIKKRRKAKGCERSQSDYINNF